MKHVNQYCKHLVLDELNKEMVLDPKRDSLKPQYSTYLVIKRKLLLVQVHHIKHILMHPWLQPMVKLLYQNFLN